MRGLIKLICQALNTLSQKGRRILAVYLISLICIASLDGFALILISKLLNTRSVQQQSNLLPKEITVIVSGVICLFVLRSLLSTISTWICLKEFALQEVEIGQQRFLEIQESPVEAKLALNESDFFTYIDRAPTNLVQGFLVSVATIGAEIASALVILGVAFKLQPVTALVASIYFVAIAWIQNKALSTTQENAGYTVFRSGNATYDLMGDFYNLSKLLHISPSRSLEQQLRKHREKLALARAKQSFIASLPRYFMESMLALGFLVIAGATWVVSGSEKVVPAIVVFAAAGFRLLPSVNRIQGLALSAVGYMPLAREAITPVSVPSATKDVKETSNKNLSPSQEFQLEVQNVSYIYPGATKKALNNVSLRFELGKRYAIVGPSGSGKTTLIDLCLGLLDPSTGFIYRAGQHNALDLGYVPQDTYVTSASIAGNVALEWDPDVIDMELVKNSLTLAQLSDHFKLEETEIDAFREIENMSGGQKQRLGLARALYRNANFLVLDEATSALDSITEFQVMDTVKSLHGKTTVVVVAHRLSTIKDADEIIYLDNGNVIGIGSFSQLAATVPQFAEQIRIGSLEIDS